MIRKEGTGMYKNCTLCPKCESDLTNEKLESKEYLLCPHCNDPIVAKSEIEKAIENGTNFCGYCGKEISNTLANALDKTS